MKPITIGITIGCVATLSGTAAATKKATREWLITRPTELYNPNNAEISQYKLWRPFLIWNHHKWPN